MKILFAPVLSRLFGQKNDRDFACAKPSQNSQRRKEAFASQRHGDYNDALQDVLQLL